MPRIHRRPVPRHTGPCGGRREQIRSALGTGTPHSSGRARAAPAQLAPARRIAAGAHGPPWYQKARPRAREPHKLASGRMSRGTNPGSALHSDMPLRLVALGKRVKLGVIRCVERELAVCSNLICLHLLLCIVVVRGHDTHCACGVFFNNRQGLRIAGVLSSYRTMCHRQELWTGFFFFKNGHGFFIRGLFWS